ncbi:unnamed protein product [Rotaria socialis]|uniref:SAM domain-containing protein n=1 Tax=Rotaria socialis TaxID=392032 RepID=A0A817SUU4_9BILA|nr:unnamed protein product [Rotaria socialis]CAF3456081.1 unnamed protein product [Rotaria socialis]CAF3639199.1 unnamed protein product [Rotaria socialis]CAF3716772.1 unnamed protein product [Rotaria socialis]
MSKTQNSRSEDAHEASKRHRCCQFKTDKEWLNLRFNTQELTLKPDELTNELTFPVGKIDNDKLDRIHGSMIGMALGDAVGAHVEFRSRHYMVAHPVEGLEGGGTWGLNKGQFTDDTSMALCLANSLIARQYYEPYDQLVRYKWWYRHGYMSSTGQCFDIGSATRQSLLEFERRQKIFAAEHKIPIGELDFLSDPELLEKFDVNCSSEGVAGNGALMRLTPVPLFFYEYPVEAVEYSGRSGLITHGDTKAYDACRYYGALIVAAVNGVKKEELLNNNFYTTHKKWFGGTALHPDIQNIADGSYKKDGYDKGIRGKGYIVNALEAALWAFWSDKGSFHDGVLAAVNLGDDTDTTAAIYGQLAGACYGYKELPKEWTAQIYAKEFIQCLSEWIAYEGAIWSPEKANPSNISSITVSKSLEQDDEIGGDRSPAVERKQKFSSTTQKETAEKISKSTKMHGQLPANDDESRARSRTITEAPVFLEPAPGDKLLSNRPRSAGKYDSASTPTRAYISSKVKSTEDVGKWLQSLDKQYKNYVKTFKVKDVDGYWLLNHVDDGVLLGYGVKDKEHRRDILNGIEKLKQQCPEHFVEKTDRQT